MYDDAVASERRRAALQTATLVERGNQVREGFVQNRTVFGAILRGELSAKILYEDEDVLVFRDIRPVSAHHTLVIPKRHIENIHHLSPESEADRALLVHMLEVGKLAVKHDFPDLDVDAAVASSALSLGFHRWPMLSVHHLHLHCIYPMPCARAWYRILHPMHYGPFYTSALSELGRLSLSARPT